MEINIFDIWNKKKQILHYKNERKFFEIRQIWWANCGQNVGDEENGKDIDFLRPVIILKKFNSNLFLAIPTSRSMKTNRYYHKITYNQKEYSALLSQAKVMDSKRLIKKIYKMDEKQFNQLLEVFINIIKN